MKVYSTLILFCICYLSLCSLEAQSSIQLSEIEVDITQTNSIIAIHTIDKGETLYSIARFYRVPLEELMSANNILPGQIISLYSEIKIPINNDMIDKSGTKKDSNWIPVTYTVKKKETLYTIGKKYFSQNIEDLNNRNDISSFIIHENENLIIGWWAKPNQSIELEAVITENNLSSDETEVVIAAETKSLTIKEKAMQIADLTKENKSIPKPILVPIEQLNTAEQARLTRIYSQENNDYINIDSSLPTIDTSFVVNVDDSRTKINKKGICLWMKDDPETTQLLAFHKSAKVGSTINIKYPLTNRSVDVVVIDNIKPNLYADDVEIIVTKAVALQLGARDSRIQINMDYYQ